MIIRCRKCMKKQRTKSKTSSEIQKFRPMAVSKTAASLLFLDKEELTTGVSALVGTGLME